MPAARPPGRSQPKVVLLDLKLPKVDGLEVIRKVRADDALKLLPIVVLTSSKEDRDVAEAYKLGANAFVSKPVEFEEFAAKVAQLGLFWLLINKPPLGVRRTRPVCASEGATGRSQRSMPGTWRSEAILHGSECAFVTRDYSLACLRVGVGLVAVIFASDYQLSNSRSAAPYSTRIISGNDLVAIYASAEYVIEACRKRSGAPSASVRRGHS